MKPENVDLLKQLVSEYEQKLPEFFSKIEVVVVNPGRIEMQFHLKNLDDQHPSMRSRRVNKMVGIFENLESHGFKIYFSRVLHAEGDEKIDVFVVEKEGDKIIRRPKHTPGPWEVCLGQSTPDGNRSGWISSTSKQHICDFGGPTLSLEDMENQDANISLVAGYKITVRKLPEGNYRIWRIQ